MYFKFFRKYKNKFLYIYIYIIFLKILCIYIHVYYIILYAHIQGQIRGVSLCIKMMKKKLKLKNINKIKYIRKIFF